MKRGLLLIFIIIAILSSSIALASLTCSVQTSASCSDTKVLLLENETGGWNNAHAQLPSVATYANAVCCSDGEDTLSTTCGDEAYIFSLSDTDDAHVEEYGLGNFATDSCLSATTNRIVCQYETTCSAGFECLASYASSEGDNTTNAHIGNCTEYTNKLCCMLNHKPTISLAKLNATTINNLTDDNLTVHITLSDTDGDAITNITDWRVDGTSIAVLNYPFDTKINSDISNLIKDYSTNNNHGTLGGGTSGAAPTWYSTCVVGGCYDFDGVDDYILAPHAVKGSNEPFTLSVWFSAKDLIGNEDILAQWAVSAGDPQIFRLILEGDDIRYRVRDSGGFNSDILVTNFVSQDTWYYLAGTFDGTDASLYINGVFNATMSPGALETSSTDQVYIGSYPNLVNEFYGFIDEVYIFNRTLSAQQVKEIYDAGVAGKQPTNILSQETSPGETWAVDVTPNDGYQDGDNLTSNGVYIYGAPLLIEYENIFVNSSSTHQFDVTAGASLATGADKITDTSIDYTGGTCFYDGNVTSGIYMNVTYTCTGTPYITSSLNITFCDFVNNCNTTQTSSNDYPNQIPTMNNLLTPSNGNNSLINRNVSFTWQAGSDGDSDAINYTLNITNGYCADIFEENLSATSFNNPTELSTYYECQNNVYFWQVKACDLWDCGAYTTLWNFSIQDYLEITITNSEMNFSTVNLLDVDDTTDDNPGAFTFENTGNIRANLTEINSTGLWTLAALDTSYYQFKANNATETGSFNWANSITTWNNVVDTGISSVGIAFLEYDLANNDAAIDIKIVVPPGEPPGSKTDTMTFTWEAAD